MITWSYAVLLLLLLPPTLLANDIVKEKAKKRTKRQTAQPTIPFDEPPLVPQRQFSDDSSILLQPNCEFGERDNVYLCNWKNLNLSDEKWLASKGTNYGWLGGPDRDHTTTAIEGGYALYDTSKLVDNLVPQSLAYDSAVMVSTLLAPTDAIGTCVDFWYAMAGLSQDRLRVLLRPPSQYLFGSRGRSNESEREILEALLSSDGRDDIVLWQERDTTDNEWVNGQVIYTYNDFHMILVEGLPLVNTDPNRLYRGYIALDDIDLKQADSCKPFCNFEGGLCSWSQDADDDFDWGLSRGSVNPSTGPPMDRFSFNYGIKGGGFAFIDSSFPRRPGDRARLLSEVFQAPGPNAPLCMRFWTHMFGPGIGALRVIISTIEGDEETIWHLAGEQGNNWYQAQVTITAQSDFQIVIEAEVGMNSLGDIAIDEISMKENACPTSPQSASKVVGDCTFEVDECGWQNVERRQLMDEIDWERTVASQAAIGPPIDHTLKTSQGTYLNLPRQTLIQQGHRGWLLSTAMDPPETPLCISFWYFLHDPAIDSSGPSLGALRLLMMEQDQQGFQTLTPLWSINNHQGPTWQYGQASIFSEKRFMIVIEGLWGTTRGSEFIAVDDITFFQGDCQTEPAKATVSLLDCDFTRDSCSYSNSSASGRSQRWHSASLSRRSAPLKDHTYGGPTGYLYFDVFNQNQNPLSVTLMSRIIPATRLSSDPKCLSFWFSAIRADKTAKLTVYREPVDDRTNDADGPTDAATRVWGIEGDDAFDGRFEWRFAQAQIDVQSDFRISFVGEAMQGGFAIDDIYLYDGTCFTRPRSSSSLGSSN